MPRKTPVRELQKDEVGASSPLRRSSRISCSSPAPTKVVTRRNSATETSTSTPKVTRSRRTSFTQEPESNEDIKVLRARRGSFSSTNGDSTVKEEVVTKGKTRGSSVPKEDTPDLRKTRRRRSVTEDTEINEESLKKNTRSRRTSITKTSETEETKPATKQQNSSVDPKAVSLPVGTPIKKSPVDKTNKTLEAIEEANKETESPVAPVTKSIITNKKKSEIQKVELDLSVINETSLTEEDITPQKENKSPVLNKITEGEVKLEPKVIIRRSRDLEDSLTSKAKNENSVSPSNGNDNIDHQEKSADDDQKAEPNKMDTESIDLNFSDSSFNLHLSSSLLESSDKTETDADVIAPSSNKENICPMKKSAIQEPEYEPMDVDVSDLEISSPVLVEKIPSNISKAKKVDDLVKKLEITEKINDEIAQFFTEEIKGALANGTDQKKNQLSTINSTNRKNGSEEIVSPQKKNVPGTKAKENGVDEEDTIIPQEKISIKNKEAAVTDDVNEKIEEINKQVKLNLDNTKPDNCTQIGNSEEITVENTNTLQKEIFIKNKEATITNNANEEINKQRKQNLDNSKPENCIQTGKTEEMTVKDTNTLKEKISIKNKEANITGNANEVINKQVMPNLDNSKLDNFTQIENSEEITAENTNTLQKEMPIKNEEATITDNANEEINKQVMQNLDNSKPNDCTQTGKSEEITAKDTSTLQEEISVKNKEVTITDNVSEEINKQAMQNLDNSKPDNCTHTEKSEEITAEETNTPQEEISIKNKEATITDNVNEEINKQVKENLDNSQPDNCTQTGESEEMTAKDTNTLQEEISIKNKEANDNVNEEITKQIKQNLGNPKPDDCIQAGKSKEITAKDTNTLQEEISIKNKEANIGDNVNEKINEQANQNMNYSKLDNSAQTGKSEESCVSESEELIAEDTNTQEEISIKNEEATVENNENEEIDEQVDQDLNRSETQIGRSEEIRSRESEDINIPQEEISIKNEEDKGEKQPEENDICELESSLDESVDSAIDDGEKNCASPLKKLKRTNGDDKVTQEIVKPANSREVTDVTAAVEQETDEESDSATSQEVVIISENEEVNVTGETASPAVEETDKTDIRSTKSPDKKFMTSSNSTEPSKRRSSLDRTSIVMQGSIKSDQKRRLSDRINKVVDMFCAGMKDKGDVEINISLECCQLPDSDHQSDEESEVQEKTASPKRTKRRKLWHPSEPVVPKSVESDETAETSTEKQTKSAKKSKKVKSTVEACENETEPTVKKTRSGRKVVKPSISEELDLWSSASYSTVSQGSVDDENSEADTTWLPDEEYSEVFTEQSSDEDFFEEEEVSLYPEKSILEDESKILENAASGSDEETENREISNDANSSGSVPREETSAKESSSKKSKKRKLFNLSDYNVSKLLHMDVSGVQETEEKKKKKHKRAKMVVENDDDTRKDMKISMKKNKKCRGADFTESDNVTEMIPERSEEPVNKMKHVDAKQNKRRRNSTYVLSDDLHQSFVEEKPKGKKNKGPGGKQVVMKPSKRMKYEENEEFLYAKPSTKLASGWYVTVMK